MDHFEELTNKVRDFFNISMKQFDNLHTISVDTQLELLYNYVWYMEMMTPL